MDDDLSLFGDDPASAEVAPVPTPISNWQVDLLRKALDARGLESMSERQAAIEAVAGRSVDSLRSLNHQEGLQALARLGKTPTLRGAGGSAWDDRDEDTWIDRL